MYIDIYLFIKSFISIQNDEKKNILLLLLFYRC